VHAEHRLRNACHASDQPDPQTGTQSDSRIRVSYAFASRLPTVQCFELGCFEMKFILLPSQNKATHGFPE
jgi:hypothetical protein